MNDAWRGSSRYGRENFAMADVRFRAPSRIATPIPLVVGEVAELARRPIGFWAGVRVFLMGAFFFGVLGLCALAWWVAS